MTEPCTELSSTSPLNKDTARRAEKKKRLIVIRIFLGTLQYESKFVVRDRTVEWDISGSEKLLNFFFSHNMTQKLKIRN